MALNVSLFGVIIIPLLLILFVVFFFLVASLLRTRMQHLRLTSDVRQPGPRHEENLAVSQSVHVVSRDLLCRDSTRCPALTALSQPPIRTQGADMAIPTAMAGIDIWPRCAVSGTDVARVCLKLDAW